jgi:hypothetical protein
MSNAIANAISTRRWRPTRPWTPALVDIGDEDDVSLADLQ